MCLICLEENKTPNKSDFATVWNLGQEKINQFWSLSSDTKSQVSWAVLKCFFSLRFICFMFAILHSVSLCLSIHPSIFNISCYIRTLYVQKTVWCIKMWSFLQQSMGWSDLRGITIHAVHQFKIANTISPSKTLTSKQSSLRDSLKMHYQAPTVNKFLMDIYCAATLFLNYTHFPNVDKFWCLSCSSEILQAKRKENPDSIL